tara:strand:- start:347 stop:787 length:441 start_codon:yes stop_codon:yes gene_type:complete
VAKTPQQFKADMRRAMRGFKGAATAARRIGYDVDAMREMRKIAADNNRRNFATDGSAMGANWEGKRAGNAILNDAVDTGKFKRNMISPYLLKARVTSKNIYFSVPKSRVPYVKYLAGRVYGWTPKSVDKIAETITANLGRIARGES